MEQIANHNPPDKVPFTWEAPDDSLLEDRRGTLPGFPSGVLRRRGWTFLPLLICRAKWEERFPNWQWRNTGLTRWQAEEAADNETNSPPEIGFEYTDASPEELVKHAEADAAKAEERARRLEKVAEIARSRAKHTPRK